MSYRAVTIDIESFYDPKSGYTLKKMTTEHYCRDPRFDIHGAAIKWEPHIPARWYDPRELRDVLNDEDWSDIFLISHHAHFDHLILNHHYGIKPAMHGCTLSMARLLLGNHISVSLDSVRKVYGLPAKITPYNLFEGKHWSELTPQIREQVADGAIDETESIWKLFSEHLAPKFPLEEFETVDSTVRMFTDPCLLGDGAVFKKVWEDESVRRLSRLQQLGVTEAELQSADRFAELLRERGVEPEMKDGKNELIYAFAKTDPFMEALQQDEDEEIRALAEARLGIKSTLLQTRSETLGWMASRGPLCIYLKYAGAHTTRWAGSDGTNFQNWTNGHEINTGIVAPDGYLIAEPDCSQVECRLLNFIAGQWDKIEEFRQGKDPYVAVASEFYGFEINKDDHPDERQLGKIVELQAGYQSGGEKIRHTVRVKSGGTILLTPAEGVKARDSYRRTHPFVQKLWADAATILEGMLQFMCFDWSPMKVVCNKEHGTRRIVLPNGIELIYDSLENHYDEEKRERYLRIRTRKGWHKMYGGALVENVIQALARVLVSQAMTRLKHLGYRCVNTKHDSLWLLIPENDGRFEEHKRTILAEMSREPSWLPGIPLAAEFKHIGKRYA